MYLYIRDMDRKIFFYNTAFGAALFSPFMNFFNINSFYQNLIFTGKSLQDFTRLAFILTCQNYNAVSLFYMHSVYITSGAKEIIFLNPNSPISLGIGPKTRPANGSLRVVSKITTAFSSKRTYVPSLRRKGARCRTTIP